MIHHSASRRHLFSVSKLDNPQVNSIALKSVNLEKMKVNKPGALDFADYIKKLPPQWVIEHFLEEFDSTRKILSSSMIDEAVKKFSTAEVLKLRFLQLPKKTQIRCALVYLSGNRGISLGTSNVFDDPLILSFLTFAAMGSDETVRIFGFDQFEKYLHTEIINVILNSATVEQIPSPPETYQGRVLNDVTTIAALCLQGVLIKKRSGGISKSATNSLKKLVDTGIPAKTEGSEYVYSVAIAYLQYKKMLIETETQYRLIVPAFKRWLAENPATLLHEIELFCFDYAGGWDRDIFLNLIKECKDNWISSSVFPELDRKDAINTLFALQFCGLIELRCKDNDLIFSKSKPVQKISPDQNRQIVVLPDFSAIIPQEVDSAQLFHFTLLGVLHSLDRVYWGKVDKNVLLDSCTRGIQSTKILEWLSGWQAPVNVLETVREWLREYMRLYISEQSMLVSSDEKVTMQINSYDPIRSFLEPVTAHAVFRIKPGNEDRVKEILNSLGFDYRMPGQKERIEEEKGLEENTEVSVNWIPVTEFEKQTSEIPVPMRGTKYGSELKILDTSEIVHVIDYAILTGGAVIFEYEGSPYLKPGLYTVRPLSFQKGIEPTFEGEITRTKSKKMFYLKKIRKIGVVQR